MFRQFSLSEFSYFVIDSHNVDSLDKKNGYPFVKILFAVRNLGFLSNIKLNLNNNLLGFSGNADFNCYLLENEKSIIDY